MKRRTLVRKLGAAGIATATISGSAAAAEGRRLSDLGVDRTFDVSAKEGWVSYDELLESHELALLPAGVSPADPAVFVSSDLGTLAIGECCDVCCTTLRKECTCACCDCTFGCEDD